MKNLSEIQQEKYEWFVQNWDRLTVVDLARGLEIPNTQVYTMARLVRSHGIPLSKKPRLGIGMGKIEIDWQRVKAAWVRGQR